MDETTFAPKPDGFRRLQNTLAGLLAALDGFQPLAGASSPRSVAGPARPRPNKS